MYRLSLYILALLALVLGLLIGTLNASSVNIDLFWQQLELPLGAALVMAFVLGILLGLFALYVFRVLPQAIQLRGLQKTVRKLEASADGDNSSLTRLSVSED
ncbi:MAG: LapA family protein [Xanthomonadales bacterium]|nr:LapA family protein [Xanthomonadales bacterium]